MHIYLLLVPTMIFTENFTRFFMFTKAHIQQLLVLLPDFKFVGCLIIQRLAQFISVLQNVLAHTYEHKHMPIFFMAYTYLFLITYVHVVAHNGTIMKFQWIVCCVINLKKSYIYLKNI